MFICRHLCQKKLEDEHKKMQMIVEQIPKRVLKEREAASASSESKS